MITIKNINKILGLRIRSYRKEKNMSQEKLAELSELHPTYIGQLERGEKNPSIETLYKISIGLEVPISILLEKIEEYDESTHPIDTQTNSTPNIPLEVYELFSVQTADNQLRLFELLKNIIEFEKINHTQPPLIS
jgi:transcriptional regulator with XRE-family HTH domain